MIYTRFGSEVKILWGNMNTGEVDVQRVNGNEVLRTNIGELKADEGIEEIENEINKVSAR